jgi:PAS domain S-box-containing protein
MKKKNVLALVGILAFITFTITFISLFIVYETTNATVSHVLRDLADGQKSMINSLLDNNVSEIEIVNILKKANKKLIIGYTGEFVVAKKIDGRIYFIFSQNPSGLANKNSTPTDTNLTVPMREAVQGRTGFIKAIDYDGDEVFAGYTFIERLNWGIVAKVDVSEVRQPFITAAYLSMFLAIFLVTLGAYFFIKVTNPILERTYQSEKRLKVSEEKLRQQYLMLQSIINSTDQPIFTLDSKFCFINYNTSYSEMIVDIYGTDIDLGKNFFDYQTVIEDNESSRVHLEAALHGDQSVHEVLFGRENHSKIFLEIAYNPIRDLNDTIIGVAVFAKDITSRKRAELALKASEEKFRYLIKNFPLPVVLKDKNGVYTFANSQFLDNVDSKYLPIEGKTDFDFFPLDLAEKIISDDSIVLESGKTKTFEMEFTNNNQYRYVIVTKMPIKGEDGLMSGILCVHLNLTELKRIEKELRESNASKDKFFSIIAHDLRNPLATYRASLVSLTDCYSDFNESERIEFLDLLRKSSEHLYELLENLLTWGRIQTGKQHFRFENVNLNSLVELCIKTHQDTAQQKGIKIVSRISESVNGYADDNIVTVIMNHLVNNAIKYSKKDGVVLLSAHVNSEQVEISVQDKGIGINPKIVNELFKLDQTQSVPGTAGEKGTGLGLILCKEFVEKLGGRIWFESVYGSGSTFYFSIPKVIS